MENLIEAIRKALDVREQYRLYTYRDGFPLSVEDMKQVVVDYTGLEIHVHRVGVPETEILARLERFPAHAHIYFSQELNLCHRRYAVAKELAQLVIDDEDSFTRNYSKLVAGLVDENFRQLLDSDGCQMSEHLAHFVAAEWLMPYAMRGPYVQQLQNSDTTFYKIADHHKMPKAHVETLLSPMVHEVIGNIIHQFDK